MDDANIDTLKSRFANDAVMMNQIDYLIEHNNDFITSLCAGLSYFNDNETLKRLITSEYEKKNRQGNSIAFSDKTKDILRQNLSDILMTKFPDNVAISDKNMTLSKKCGLGGKNFCCEPLSSFTNSFIAEVTNFFREKKVNYTLSVLFDKIYIKENFFTLTPFMSRIPCLTTGEQDLLRKVIGDKISMQTESEGGSHSRRKHRTSKKSRKSHRRRRHHRRSSRNKKHHTKRHTKRYRKRK